MIISRGKFLKNSLDWKSKLVQSTQVSAWLSNITFHLQPIWLQTLVAIDSESCQRSLLSVCSQPSEVAVLFYWNLNRRPFLRQVVDFDLLLCTGFNLQHADLFLSMILLRDQWIIEILSEVRNTALVSKTFSQNPSKIDLIRNFCFTWKTILSSVTRYCPLAKFTKYYFVLTLKSRQHRKSGSNFSSREPVIPSSNSSWLKNAWC